MDRSLIAELKNQATFVAGKGSYVRNEESPEVVEVIKNAEQLLTDVEKKLEIPEISGGTTANPETVLSLFWPVPMKRGIFGLTVDFKKNNTCRVSWSSPDIKNYTIDDLSLQEVMKIDIARILYNVKLSARAHSNQLIP